MTKRGVGYYGLYLFGASSNTVTMKLDHQREPGSLADQRARATTRSAAAC